MEDCAEKHRAFPCAIVLIHIWCVYCLRGFVLTFPGGRAHCHYAFGVGRTGRGRELGVKESYLEKIIWLFIYSLFRQRDLKKALRRVAEISSKSNWRSLKGQSVLLHRCLQS